MITQTPQRLVPYIVGRGSFTYLNEVHEYLVIDPEYAHMQGAPPVFTICKNGVLAISDDYPAPWRELGLIHELVEQCLGKDENACLEALQQELSLLDERAIDTPSYLAFRMNFFEKLISFYQNNEDFAGRDDLIKRLTHSLDHLKSLCSS